MERLLPHLKTLVLLNECGAMSLLSFPAYRMIGSEVLIRPLYASLAPLDRLNSKAGIYRSEEWLRANISTLISGKKIYFSYLSLGKHKVLYLLSIGRTLFFLHIRTFIGFLDTHLITTFHLMFFGSVWWTLYCWFTLCYHYIEEALYQNLTAQHFFFIYVQLYMWNWCCFLW